MAGDERERIPRDEATRDLPAPTGALSPAKKAAGDATSEEEAGRHLALVASLRQAGGFHPLVEVGRDWLRSPGRCLALVVIPFYPILVEIVPKLLEPWRFFRFPATQVPFFFYAYLPLAGVFLVGAQRHRLEEGNFPGLRELVLGRSLGYALRALPALLVCWFLLAVSSTTFDLLPREAYFQLVVGLHLLLSLVWAYVVCELVLARGSLLDGPRVLVRDLVGLAGETLGWIRRPSAAALSSGLLPLLPYFLLLWGLTLGGAFLGGASTEWSGNSGLLGLLLGSALGYQIGVSVFAWNYMGKLVARAPLFLEEDGTGGTP